MLLVLDVDRNLDIHLECAVDYVHVGLAAAVDNARTPSFVLYFFLLRDLGKWRILFSRSRL